jgi:apolipoprotein D and lipocalin family protein
MRTSRIIRRLRLSVPALFMLSLAGCASSPLPPLTGMQEPLDLPRFMGDWYVLAFIPIDLPFISEKDAHNGVESYRLAADGTIETTYTFRDGGFDGPARRMTPRARVANPPLNTEWKMKFFWFLPAGDFLIIDRDAGYTRTVITVPRPALGLADGKNAVHTGQRVPGDDRSADPERLRYDKAQEGPAKH